MFQPCLLTKRGPLAIINMKGRCYSGQPLSND